MVLSRSRWVNVLVALAMIFSAAVGGALVSGVDLAGAGPSSGVRAVTETITPCRIMETRATEGSVGPQATPVTAGQTVTLPVSGAAGKGGCAVQAGLVGAVLNITAVNATFDTFVTVYPCDAPRPTASTLNPFPNRITFNSAVVDLSATGTVCIYNNGGSVDIVIDVTGVLYDHNHDDRYYTEAEMNASLAPNPLVLSAADFHFGSGNPDYRATVWAGVACWAAPLNLPNGAILNEIRVFVIDVTTANMSGQLARQLLVDSVGAAFVAGPTTNTVVGNTSFIVPVPAGTTIASTHSYMLKICGNDANDFFEAVQVTWSGGSGLPTFALDGEATGPGDPSVNG